MILGRIHIHIKTIFLLITSLIIGIVGFMWIENFNFLESLFISIITFFSFGRESLGLLSHEGFIWGNFYSGLNFTIIIYIIFSYLYRLNLKQVLLKKIFNISLVFILINLIIGTIGFMLIENYTFLQSLNLSSSFLLTFGFAKIPLLSDKGMFFTLIYIILNYIFIIIALYTSMKNLYTKLFIQK